MGGETRAVAAYMAPLQASEIPTPALRRAMERLIDTLAAAVFGHDFVRSRIVSGLAHRRPERLENEAKRNWLAKGGIA